MKIQFTDNLQSSGFFSKCNDCLSLYFLEKEYVKSFELIKENNITIIKLIVSHYSDVFKKYTIEKKDNIIELNFDGNNSENYFCMFVNKQYNYNILSSVIKFEK